MFFFIKQEQRGSAGGAGFNCQQGESTFTFFTVFMKLDF